MATNNKYDRQLRLWGANGQAALGAAHVLLLGAGCAGTETLKNLVLPGIGSFTIVDGEVVCEADVKNNFFVRKSDLGKPRAAVTAELLQELNAEVCGAHQISKPADFIEGDLSQFTLIIAAGCVDPATLARLGEACWNSWTPLIVCRAYGLLGTVRLQLRGHEIVESKPENVFWDLRLQEPFEELTQIVEECDLDSLSDVAHAHVPFVLILCRLAQRWKQEHGGLMPKTRDEKDAFRSWIPAAARELPSKVPEMNFEEAEQHAYRAWADPRELPYKAQSAIDAALALSEEELKKPTAKFAIMLRAVAEFMRVDNNGLPPLAGAIPDMHADTVRYVALQQAYLKRAKKDAEKVIERHAAILLSLGLPEASTEELLSLCKHVRDVKTVTTKSLAEERDGPNLEELASDLYEAEDEITKLQTPALWYIALRAADLFYVSNQRWPGTSGDLEEDAMLLGQEMELLLKDTDGCFQGGITPAHAHEIVRFGAAELHPVAAVVGGVASQEAVKIIAKQYTPINHTYLFNGIACTASTLEP